MNSKKYSVLVVGIFAARVIIMAFTVLSPPLSDVLENSSVTLTCRWNGREEEQVSKWTVRDTSFIGYIYFDNNDTCSSAGDISAPDSYAWGCAKPSTFSITLKSVKREEHMEEWYCIMSYRKSFPSKILVQVPVESVEMISHPGKRIAIKENTSDWFECKTSSCRPTPIISWFLISPDLWGNINITDKAIQTSTAESSSDFTEVTSVLNYRFDRTLNNWFIYCQAANIPGKNVTSSRKQLDIWYPPDRAPVITDTDGGKYRVVENHQGQLSCVVTGGNPLATLTWFCFNDYSNVSEFTRLDTVTSTVTWIALRSQHGKICTCVTEHSFGTTNVSVKVEILYKASILQFYIRVDSTVKNSFTVSEDDNVTFVCNIESRPTPNASLSHNGRIIHISASNNSLVYTYKNIQCSYLGSPRPSPFFELIDNLNSPRYTSATLRFSTLAFPEPGPSGFTWYYVNGSERIMLTDSHSVVITSLLSHSILTITNVTQSEYGEYCLRITNQIGVYEQQFSLNPLSSTPCPNNAANSSSAVAFIAVGVGTSVASLICVGSVLFVHRFMRRKKPKIQQNVHGDYRRHIDEPATASTDNYNVAEYEQISMKPVEVSASTVQKKESVSGNESANHYDILVESRKERDCYTQLPDVHQQKEISRENTECVPTDSNEIQHTVQDYINIKI